MTDEQRNRDRVTEAVATGLRDVAIDLVRRWNRLRITLEAPLPDEPALVVCNHGFGGAIDLNVLAVMATFEDHGTDRPVTYLSHQLAWTLGVGQYFESVGARVANRENAMEALAAGHHVVVFPGGDVDAGKSFADRNVVQFAGRTGFARTAMEAGVPIVPIVTAGAGESLLVLSDGQKIAKRLRLPELARYKVAPISLSIPWGINVGLVGLLPYLPLPAKLDTRVLPVMRPDEDATPESWAADVHAAMQAAMDDMTADRTWLVG